MIDWFFLLKVAEVDALDGGQEAFLPLVNGTQEAPFVESMAQDLQAELASDEGMVPSHPALEAEVEGELQVGGQGG